MQRIEVWIQLHEQPILAGEIVCDVKTDGRCLGAFRYSIARWFLTLLSTIPMII